MSNLIIDTHTHITNSPELGFSSHEECFKKMLSEAKSAKVDHLIVITGLGISDDMGSDFISSTEKTLKMIEGHKNVSVVAGVAIEYKMEDLKKIEKLVADKKIIGIKFYTGYQHFYPNDKRCIPVYEMCEKYNIPVIFHTGDTLAGYVKKPLVQYSHPLHVDEAATNFPNLKIVIAHVGNPWMIDCAEVLYKNKNVYADISGLMIDDASPAYKLLMKQRLTDLITYVGENKLMYGTDWSLISMKKQIAFAKSLKLSKSEENKLFYQNAQKVFNL